jgi:hypothetical protein
MLILGRRHPIGSNFDECASPAGNTPSRKETLAISYISSSPKPARRGHCIIQGSSHEKYCLYCLLANMVLGKRSPARSFSLYNSVTLNASILQSIFLAGTVAQVLYLSSPLDAGGLDLNPRQMALLYSVRPIMSNVVNLGIYPRLARRYQTERILNLYFALRPRDDDFRSSSARHDTHINPLRAFDSHGLQWGYCNSMLPDIQF